MAKTRVFISFDFDHDEDLKNLLVGQSKHPDTDFELADWSIKEAITRGDWKEKARQRIRAVDVVAVLCGTATHTAAGVSAELSIAQGEQRQYFLLEGRSSKVCTRPTAARPSDKMYTWTWENLKTLIAGGR